MFPPLLLQEWHSRNNCQLTNYARHSHHRAWWMCSVGHEWQARICDRNARVVSGCPQCNGRVKSVRHDRLTDWPNLVTEWDEKNDNLITDYTPGCHYRAWWKCVRGHEWQAQINHRARKINPSGCPHCSKRLRHTHQTSDYPHLVAEWHVKNGSGINKYTPGSRYKAWWICSLGHEWQTQLYHRTGKNASGCPYGFRR